MQRCATRAPLKDVQVIDIRLSRDDASRQLTTIAHEVQKRRGIHTIATQRTRFVPGARSTFTQQFRKMKRCCKIIFFIALFSQSVALGCSRAALVAILVAMSGWSGAKPAGITLRRYTVIFVIAMDLEFLVGLLLYFGASPITRTALTNMSAAMSQQEPRFFTVEHTLLMFLAVVCAHVGGALSRKGRTDAAKYRGAAIAFAISLLLMLAGIPWWRPLFRLGS